MKKIINNKVYDTATARKVGTWCSAELPNDIQYVEETLYRKKNGEFFLHGFGGPASVYSRPAASGGSLNGEKIMPLSYEQARQWVEKNLSSEVYEAVFGAIQEDGSRVDAHVSISASVWDAAKREASRRGINVSDLVESLLKRCITR